MAISKMEKIRCRSFASSVKATGRGATRSDTGLFRYWSRLCSGGIDRPPRPQVQAMSQTLSGKQQLRMVMLLHQYYSGPAPEVEKGERWSAPGGTTPGGGGGMDEDSREIGSLSVQPAPDLQLDQILGGEVLVALARRLPDELA